MKNKIFNLKEKIFIRIQRSEIPVIVYAVLFFGMLILWMFRKYNEDIALNFLVELFGAAFTLFIINVLLVRTKTQPWKVVKDEINYLISRNVYKIRDGICTRMFNFTPVILPELNEVTSLQNIREQRHKFLLELEFLNEELTNKLNIKETFSEKNYEYFNDKSEEIWSILNMKYSDYFEPEIVFNLIFI